MKKIADCQHPTRKIFIHLSINFKLWTSITPPPQEESKFFILFISCFAWLISLFVILKQKGQRLRKGKIFHQWFILHLYCACAWSKKKNFFFGCIPQSDDNIVVKQIAVLFLYVFRSLWEETNPNFTPKTQIYVFWIFRLLQWGLQLLEIPTGVFSRIFR